MARRKQTFKPFYSAPAAGPIWDSMSQVARVSLFLQNGKTAQQAETYSVKNWDSLGPMTKGAVADMLGASVVGKYERGNPAPSAAAVPERLIVEGAPGHITYDPRLAVWQVRGTKTNQIYVRNVKMKDADAYIAKRYKEWEAAARPNPVGSAAAMRESFTGIPSTHEIVVTEPIREHAHLAAIGPLVALKLRSVHGRLKFDKDTYLAINESGTQLFIRGGDQSIDIAAFNASLPPRRALDPNKETLVLGEIDRVYYRAAKPFLGGEHTKTGVYDHRFGEESGQRPVLVYDRRSRLLSIAGGRYYVKRTDYDGKHSRGIVD